MSASLVKRWRASARVHDRAAASMSLGDLTVTPAEVVAVRAYGEALRRCADSLERSLLMTARRRLHATASKGAR